MGANGVAFGESADARAITDAFFGSNKNVVSFIPEHWYRDQKFLAITGDVKTVGKPERISRRLFQAVVEIIKKKLPQATDFDFHSCGSLHSALRPEFPMSPKSERPQVGARSLYKPASSTHFL